MMHKISSVLKIALRKAKEQPFLILLFLVMLVLCGANYEPGTTISGWDTLHPEFNLGEYFMRVIFGVWQPHQGLGALATQSHAAELPRLLIYYPLTRIFPLFFVRYAYFFLTILTGSIGVYVLLRNIFLKDSPQPRRDIASFAGGLFYPLNLGILQHFYVPLEMFATHFAILPWIFFTTIRYLEHPTRKRLLLFGIVTFFGAPMAHTATLWYAFIGAFVFYLVIYSLLTRTRKATKASLMLVFWTFLVNSFWLLPNLYFTLTEGHIIEGANIHKLFTQEAFLQNASFGTLPDLGLFKNFLFNWGEYVGSNKFGSLMYPFQHHLQNPFILLIGYGFFIIMLGGIISLVKSKQQSALPLIAVFALAAFFWFNINPPLGFLFTFFQNSLPFFREAFRFPFTKFSIMLLFAASVFFSYGILFLLTVIEKRMKRVFFSYAFAGTILVLFISYMFPAFQGNYINPAMKVVIPQDYFAMFQWFNKQPSTARVAPLPIHSLWGWVYYNWGYQGAGFLWFGIKQPLLDREFDRWNPENEQYYREMSYAVYKQDPQLFEQVLTKYDISYLLVDKNVISPGTDPEVLFQQEIETLLTTNEHIHEASHFGKNLHVYEFDKAPKTPVYTISPAVVTKIASPITNEDTVFTSKGNYITDSTNPDATSAPLDTFINNQNRINPQALSFTQDGVRIHLPGVVALQSDRYLLNEPTIPARAFIARTGNAITISFAPLFPIKTSQTSPASITADITAHTNGFILSINRTQTITLGPLGEGTKYSVGTVTLNTQQDNSISLFDPREEKPVHADFTPISYSVFPCDQKTSKVVFGINLDPTGSGFSLYGKNTPICDIVPFQTFIPELGTHDGENLLRMDYTYKGGYFGSLCIVKLKDGSCAEADAKTYTTDTEASHIRTTYFGFLGSETKDFGIKLFLDTTHSPAVIKDNLFDSIDYKSFSFGVTKPFSETTLSGDTIAQATSTASSDTTSTVTIPYKGSSQYTTDVSNLPITSGDCLDNVFDDAQNKKEIFTQQSDSFIRYTSLSGSLCDHFSYQHVPLNQGYLIAITSRNLAGLPLRLCIANYYSKRCDIYSTLTESHNFVTDTYMLPPMSLTSSDASKSALFQGFDLNVNNFGIRRETSINDIKSIQVIPFPYNWLQGLGQTGTLPITQKTVLQGRKINSSLYEADLPSATPQVLVLSQGYMPGWHAYAVTRVSFLTEAFPFLFGTPLTKHIIANGWANGWAVDSSLGSKNHVLMIYTPQYFEYAGFGLLVITFGLISTQLFRHRLRSRRFEASHNA